MDDGVKDFRVAIKVKNNRLLTALEQAGFDSVPAFVTAIGGNGSWLTDTYALLAMRSAPINRKTGEWKPLVVRMCEVLHKMPDDLFPEHVQRQHLKSNSAEFEVDAGELAALLPVPDPSERDPQRLLIDASAKLTLDEVLAKLSPQQQDVLRRRFGFDGEPETLKQIADIYGLSQERIREIEQKALRKLRRPVNADALADVFDVPAHDAAFCAVEDEAWNIHNGVKDGPPEAQR